MISHDPSGHEGRQTMYLNREVIPGWLKKEANDKTNGRNCEQMKKSNVSVHNYTVHVTKKWININKTVNGIKTFG